MLFNKITKKSRPWIGEILSFWYEISHLCFGWSAASNPDISTSDHLPTFTALISLANAHHSAFARQLAKNVQSNAISLLSGLYNEIFRDISIFHIPNISTLPFNKILSKSTRKRLQLLLSCKKRGHNNNSTPCTGTGNDAFQVGLSQNMYWGTISPSPMNWESSFFLP